MPKRKYAEVRIEQDSVADQAETVMELRLNIKKWAEVLEGEEEKLKVMTAEYEIAHPEKERFIYSDRVMCTVTRSSRKTIKGERLLQLGVEPEVVQKATETTEFPMRKWERTGEEE